MINKTNIKFAPAGTSTKRQNVMFHKICPRRDINKKTIRVLVFTEFGPEKTIHHVYKMCPHRDINKKTNRYFAKKITARLAIRARLPGYDLEKN